MWCYRLSWMLQAPYKLSARSVTPKPHYNHHMLLKCLALSTLLSCNLWSQALSGTIVGAVTDAAGAVVANAKVTLTNEGTHFLRVVITNSSGQYVASSVPTGNYSIAVEMQGFQRTVRDGVALTAADTVTVDFKLAVGDVK